VKSERVTQIIELQRAVSLKKNQAMIGKIVPVLIEGDGKRSSQQWLGRTDGGMVTIFPKTDSSLKPGSLTSVIITDATVTTLYGESL
jgi:tRNA-2-methylthio-N6-dimethylallyladenosine synthase